MWMAVARHPDWYLEYSEDLNTAEGKKQLRGKWIIALPELSAFSRRETRDVKAFITRQAENFRDIYERMHEDHKRSSVLCGDTNDDSYFTDPTGNRRYWPIATGGVRLEALTEDMDQIWAEAVYRRRVLFEKFWPELGEDDDFISAQRAAVADRYKKDAWHETIANWLDVRKAGGKDVSKLHNATILAYDILEMRAKDVSQTHQERIGNVLKMLGYERKSVWLDNRTQQGWHIKKGD
jgi:putative DNA primase/helicase